MNRKIVNVFVCFLWESSETLNSYFHSFGSRMQFLMCIIEFLIPLIAKEYKVQRAGQQNHWEARAENEYCILCSAILHSAILFRLALCPLQHCVPMTGLISLVFSLWEESEGNLCGWQLVPPARHAAVQTVNLSSALSHLLLTFIAMMTMSSSSCLANICVCNWTEHTQLGNDCTSAVCQQLNICKNDWGKTNM